MDLKSSFSINNSFHICLFVCSYSCGYKKVFEEYVGILREKYPEIKVDGDHYNPPGYNMLISKILVHKQTTFYIASILNYICQFVLINVCHFYFRVRQKLQ